MTYIAYALLYALIGAGVGSMTVDMTRGHCPHRAHKAKWGTFWLVAPAWPFWAAIFGLGAILDYFNSEGPLA